MSDSADYDAIKAAILVRYDINVDAFKNRFRSSKRKDGETNREFAVRMMDSLTKWLKEYKTADQVHQVSRDGTTPELAPGGEEIVASGAQTEDVSSGRRVAR